MESRVQASRSEKSMSGIWKFRHGGACESAWSTTPSLIVSPFTSCSLDRATDLNCIGERRLRCPSFHPLHLLECYDSTHSYVLCLVCVLYIFCAKFVSYIFTVNPPLLHFFLLQYQDAIYIPHRAPSLTVQSFSTL